MATKHVTKHVTELVPGDTITIPAFWPAQPAQKAKVEFPARRAREWGLWTVTITYPGDKEWYLHLVKDNETVGLG